VNILILSATKHEVFPLVEALGKPFFTDGKLSSFQFGKLKTDLLISGIGMVAKAFWLGKYLSEKKYDFALNTGIAGSFASEIKIGEVVNVSVDQFSEIGALVPDGFLTASDLHFNDFDTFPFHSGLLINQTDFSKSGIQNLKQVTGITANTVHGEINSILQIKEKFHPDIETMGGAAFLYGCLIEKIPCAQIRAISNFVEERDKSRWNIPLAVKNLTTTTIEILDYLNKSTIENE
jgi:futalosine hydrolase